MIFSEKSIRDILDNKKTMTRRLAKKGEDWIETIGESNIVGVGEKEYIAESGIRYHKLITKWRVGKSYAVQNGRGKKGLYYCNKCKKIVKKAKGLDDTLYSYCDCVDKRLVMSGKFLFNSGKSLDFWFNKNGWKPLRIKITGIKKEKLMSMPFKDLAKEGYDDLLEYLGEFCRLNKFDIEEIAEINPEVWVLEFEVL